MIITRCFKTPDRNYRRLYIIIPSLLLLILLSSSSFTITSLTGYVNPFFSSVPKPPIAPITYNHTQLELSRLKKLRRDELNRSKIAICLVGGARRFELTGPSIIENLLQAYPNSDFFLHSPLDKDSFKFSLLKGAPKTTKLVSIRIFKPKHIQETEVQSRVLTAGGSPNGIQGLLQYFSLVEGCITMIKDRQRQNNFTYDWILRTRVDGYWSAQLDPENFIPGEYLIPPGSNFGGLNDRLGLGDLNSSTVALSRLSLIPELDSYGYTHLNSESAFKAQLKIQGVQVHTNRLPFCIVSDRKYAYPPDPNGVPVASISSPGPLSGAKCRPCKPICVGRCVGNVMRVLYKWHGWTNWENGSLQLCDAHNDWDLGWEKLFDRAAGKKFAAVRKRIKNLRLEECIKDFEKVRTRTANWQSPPVAEICRLGLSPK